MQRNVSKAEALQVLSSFLSNLYPPPEICRLDFKPINFTEESFDSIDENGYRINVWHAVIDDVHGNTGHWHWEKNLCDDENLKFSDVTRIQISYQHALFFKWVCPVRFELLSDTGSIMNHNCNGGMSEERRDEILSALLALCPNVK